MEKFLKKFGIYLVLLLALILRLININQSLWLDEAISALAARNYSFYAIIFEFIKGDNHPPLFYLILRGWGAIFGFSDIALRSLPVIFGVATVWVTYLFLKKLFDQKIALLGSFLLAISPLHIYYSQEIRMYPLLGFWAVLLMYVFSFLVDEKAKVWQWVLFSVLLAMFVGTDYVALFLLPAFLVLGKWGELGVAKLVISFIPLGIVAILWLSMFLVQIETARSQLSALPGWRDLAGGATLKEVMVLWMKFVLGRISFEPKIIYYLLVGIFSLPILVSLYKTINFQFQISNFKFPIQKDKTIFPLWGYLLIPLIGSFLFSFLVPAFNYFRFIYVLPAFYGLIAVGLSNITNKTVKFTIVVLLVTGNLTGTGFYFFDQSNQREMWRQSVEYIENEDPQLVLFEFPEPFAPFNWYSTGKVEGFGALNALNSNKVLTSQKISNKITPEVKQMIYVSYLKDLTDGEDNLRQNITQMGFLQVKSRSFSGVGEVISYERK